MASGPTFIALVATVMLAGACVFAAQANWVRPVSIVSPSAYGSALDRAGRGKDPFEEVAKHYELQARNLTKQTSAKGRNAGISQLFALLAVVLYLMAIGWAGLSQRPNACNHDQSGSDSARHYSSD